MKWKLVPVEPTPTQIRSGQLGVTTDCTKAIYRAMLEAAPQPPKLSDERILELLGYETMPTDEAYSQIVQKIMEIVRAIEREILGG